MILGVHSPAAVMQCFRSLRNLTIWPRTVTESAEDLTHLDEPLTVTTQRSGPVCDHFDINADHLIEHERSARWIIESAPARTRGCCRRAWAATTQPSNSRIMLMRLTARPAPPTRNSHQCFDEGNHISSQARSRAFISMDEAELTTMDSFDYELVYQPCLRSTTPRRCLPEFAEYPDEQSQFR